MHGYLAAGRADRRPWHPLVALLATAALIALVGSGYAIAISPLRHPLPLDPAAGVALACAIAFGRAGVLGVLIGSIATQLALPLIRNDPVLVELALALGAAAAVQAAVGAWGVARRVHQPLTLTEPRDIALFFAFGGAAATAAGTLLAMLALYIAGTGEDSQLLSTAIAWWSGQMLGVLLVAPVGLALLGSPGREWAPRRAAIGASLLTLLLLLSVVAVRVDRLDEARAQARFDRDVMAAAASLEHHLQRPLLALEAMNGVFVASEEVTRTEWRRASAAWLTPASHIEALGWVRRVATGATGELEAEARAAGLANYRVRGTGGAAPTADTAAVIHYIEPQAAHVQALGIDALSIPAARAAIERSITTGRPAASTGFRLVQDRPDERRLAIVVYRAVFENRDTTPNRREAAVRGVVFATLRIDEVLASAFSELPSDLSICLLDTSEGLAAARPLASGAGCDAEPRSFSYERQLGFADRTWRLRIASDSGTAARRIFDNTLLVSLVGLALAAMLGALLLGLTGRARRIEAAVAERTAALTEEVREREQAEAAMRESEQRFRNIFNNVPIGVAYTALDGQLQNVNPQFCRLTGYSSAELLRMNGHDFLHPDDVADDQRLTARLLNGDISMHRGEGRVVRKDGEIVRVRASLTLLRDASGSPRRLVGVMEDITDHLRRVQAEQAREQAESANLAKNEFLSRMSHELRTPLNAMLGFAQLLEMDPKHPLADPQRTWVTQIQQAGWHLLDMINDVLDLSRIESGNLRLQAERLDIEPLVEASLRLIDADAARRGIVVRREFGRAPMAVVGDATRVRQILINLFSNAVKYNIDYGKIEVRIEASAGGVDVAVQDSGLGMSRDQLAELFQPFNRLGRERSGMEGTGIGLVISKRLAECMGGDLRVESSPGEGSTFTLTLPMAGHVDTVRDNLGPDSVLPSDYHRRVVHYIEDNETNVEVMRGIVAQRPQVRMNVSLTGAQARAELRREVPDIILLDMNLPDVDGLELLREIKAEPATVAVPLVVVSADALPAQIDVALAAGAIRYVTKPVSVSEVLRVLDELLDAATTRPIE